MFTSYLGMEISLFLLLVVSQYLYTFDKQKILLGFIYGVFVAGGIQILLVFFDVVVARWVVSVFCLVASVLLYSSIANRDDKLVCRNFVFDAGSGLRESKDGVSAKELHSFKQCMWMIFLVSLVIMGVYSRWQGQQDGATASILIQVCSGLGLISAAAFFTIAQKYLKVRSLFFLCQTIVLPITLGSLYIGTIFEGPGISISVLLFDLAYGLILFLIWLAPFVYTKFNVVYTITVGFFAHKMGWAIGLCLTRSFPWQDYIWIGTIAIIVAFLILIVLSGMSIVKSRHDTDEALSTEPEYGFESACKIVGEHYALTKRENEVLLLLAKGRTAPYLARDLFLSENTVRTHISHIYRKTGVNSQQELLDEIEQTHDEFVRAKTE